MQKQHFINAMLITAIVIALTSATARTVQAEQAATPRTDIAPPMYKKLLIVDLDPVLPTRDGKKLQEYTRTRPTKEAVVDYVARLKEASHGILNYEVTYETLNEFPRHKNGFRVDAEKFPDHWEAAHAQPTGGWWTYPYFDDIGKTGFQFDYEHYIKEWNLVERVNKGEVDEVWFFAEFAGAYETVMVGKGAYWINGIGIEADCKPFRINSIAKHRTDTPLENLGHSAESILRKIYKSDEMRRSRRGTEMTTWDRFAAYDKVLPEKAVAGNVHFAPNSQNDYDWGNKEKVWSAWRDWRDNYPHLKGEKELVDTTVWGNGDNLAHKTWWFSCFPHFIGRDEKGYSHNWWEYYQNFVHTAKLEITLDGKPVDGAFAVEKGKTYDIKVFATLTDRSRIDVTNDCIIVIGKDGNDKPYFAIDTEAQKLTGLISTTAAKLTVWRDGVVAGVVL